MKVGLKLAFALVAASLGLVVVVPSAGAAITGSQITTPTDPTFGLSDDDSPNTIAISGTTTGGTPGVDQVDIRCYHGLNETASSPVRSGVTVALDGSFSVSDADPGTLSNQMCHLRAVPAGTVPFGAALDPFDGPLMMVGERGTNFISGGPNDGAPYEYYIYAQQEGAAFDYDSLGSCGICDGYLFDSNLDSTTTTFWGNNYFPPRDATPATRSDLRVDGTDAYPADPAQSINENAAGFPAFSYDISQDPANGNTTITESNAIVTCSPDTSYPPDPTRCASFVDSGVRVERTIVQDHDGHLATVTDHWVSTDGVSHSLDLLPENDQHFYGDTGSGTNVAYKFPGESSFSTHAVGETVNFGTAAPGAVYINVDGSTDGDTGTGQGAIVFDRPANPATFITSSTSFSGFHFHQTATVPATGCASFRTAYAQDYTSASVQSLAQDALSSFATPDGTCVAPPPSGGGQPPVTPTPTKKKKKCKKHKKHKKAGAAKKKKCKKKKHKK